MDRGEERALVERARTDPEAFGEIYERYYDPIFGYALRRLGSAVLAEDVAADTFLKAFAKLWQFRWQGAPFSAWLYRIAGNEIRMHFRAAARRTRSLEQMLADEEMHEPADPGDLEAELMDAEEAVARDLVAREARELIASLPERYAEALSLRFVEEKSVLEIAEILGKPEGTVKSLLSRGAAKLREAVANAQRTPPQGIPEGDAGSPAQRHG